MTGKIEYTDLGPAEVVRTTQKAALVRFEDDDLGERWMPFSVLSTPTAAECEEDSVIDRFRVETWFAEKLD